jgi:hypothetical protein
MWAEEGGHVPRRGGGAIEEGEGGDHARRGEGERGGGGGEGRGEVRRTREGWG